MRRLFVVIGVVGLSYILILFQLGIVLFLPSPVNYINVILIASLLVALSTKLSITIFIAMVPAFFLELFSYFPFGTILFAMLLSVTAARYISAKIFIHRSPWLIACAGALGITVFQFSCLFIALASGQQNFISIFNTTYLISSLWTVSLNAIIIFIGYNIFQHFYKSLDPMYISR